MKYMHLRFMTKSDNDMKYGLIIEKFKENIRRAGLDTRVRASFHFLNTLLFLVEMKSVGFCLFS